MPQNDTHDRARSLRRLSVDELGAYALQEELIDAIETSKDQVVIIQGDHRFVLRTRQATTFLIGMLRGRSWFVDDPHSSPASRGLEHATSIDPKQRAEPRSPTRANDAPPQDVALRALLAFTKEAGIIEGFEGDEEARAVRIDIAACSTHLPYVEAVNYLFDCIEHEMRSSMKRRNAPGRSPSTLANEQ